MIWPHKNQPRCAMRDRTLEPNPAILCSQPLSKSHEMSCICHAYVMHMSCNAAIRSAFRPNSDPNVDATTDSAGMLNLAATCNKCATANNNMFTTCSQHVPTSYKRKRQTETSCRSCRVSQHALHWRSTCWWPTWHQQTIQANRSSLLAPMGHPWGTHLRRQEILDNIWAIFGQL
jgi:hypothetical protein